MRLKGLSRCSASIAAITMFASPALAQDQQPGAPDAQEAPADSTDTSAAGQPDVNEGAEEIVVTGIRESLRSTQNIRRNSRQIVDSIVAEDIGKLPDLSVSDTAARIPGVQVVRTGGEASSVLIRGLPDFATTYNGREIFTAETRVVALQDFPSSNIAALEVFKTSTANWLNPALRLGQRPFAPAVRLQRRSGLGVRLGPLLRSGR
jgi:outer membrane receptor protein involved in Fe transport